MTEDSLTKICAYLDKHEPWFSGSAAVPDAEKYEMPRTLTISRTKEGWLVSVQPKGIVVSIRHPKFAEALRRAADNLPPFGGEDAHG